MKQLNLKTIASTAIIIIALFLNSATQKCSAVPARPTPFKVEQPNGDTITIRLFGDEHYSFRTTIDGFLIVQNKRGYYCYARINYKDKIVASWRKVHPTDKRRRCEIRYTEKMKKNKKLYRVPSQL